MGISCFTAPKPKKGRSIVDSCWIQETGDKVNCPERLSMRSSFSDFLPRKNIAGATSSPMHWLPSSRPPPDQPPFPPPHPTSWSTSSSTSLPTSSCSTISRSLSQISCRKQYSCLPWRHQCIAWAPLWRRFKG